ncbi:four-helix bundle copper-binding protein [Methylobacterium sp. 77]|uniref:four-helix bundle copper-binding protein n=1 Tax=Methylobacterium sp. 77 TaxID=1101192 RepID=UPI00035E2D25|nr:four-helix bundle copper-binding protein [Methylobacterium sp. 77]
MTTSRDRQACIDECLHCYRTCLGMASEHCLPAGGKHVEPEHFRLMLACAEICRTSAHLMLLGVPDHRQTCRACADICEACAESCEAVGDMETCAAECRRCAESCRAMAA